MAKGVDLTIWFIGIPEAKNAIILLVTVASRWMNLQELSTKPLTHREMLSYLLT